MQFIRSALLQKPVSRSAGWQFGGCGEFAMLAAMVFRNRDYSKESARWRTQRKLQKLRLNIVAAETTNPKLSVRENSSNRPATRMSS